MKKTRLLGAAVCLAVAGGASTAHAAARVFVSVNGVDTGDCANVNSPCRTLNFAVAAVDAGGEVIVVTTGSYAGATITKSVKIDVPTGVVAFSASPITINAAASDVVVVRGMTLKSVTPNSGTGIDFVAGGVLHVENCVLDSWSIGIGVTSPNSETLVSGTVARNNGHSGLDLNEATAKVSVFQSRFDNNGHVFAFCGLTVMSGKASARASEASGNAIGFCATSSAAAEVNVEDSLVADNSRGILAEMGAIGRASNNTVLNNSVSGLLQASGATFESRGNNTVRGNGTDVVGTIMAISGQ